MDLLCDCTASLQTYDSVSQTNFAELRTFSKDLVHSPALTAQPSALYGLSPYVTLTMGSSAELELIFMEDYIFRRRPLISIKRFNSWISN